MQSKWFRGITILALLAIWGISLAWSSEEVRRNHEEMLVVLREMDTYGSFPLISAAVKNQNISDYDECVRDGELTYSFFYNSVDVEGELEAYKKYLLRHGYTDAMPNEKTEGILAVYHRTDDFNHQIKILQTNYGYELQFSGF